MTEKLSGTLSVAVFWVLATRREASHAQVAGELYGTPRGRVKLSKLLSPIRSKFPDLLPKLKGPLKCGAPIDSDVWRMERLRASHRYQEAIELYQNSPLDEITNPGGPRDGDEDSLRVEALYAEIARSALETFISCCEARVKQEGNSLELQDTIKIAGALETHAPEDDRARTLRSRLLVRSATGRRVADADCPVEHELGTMPDLDAHDRRPSSRRTLTSRKTASVILGLSLLAAGLVAGIRSLSAGGPATTSRRPTLAEFAILDSDGGVRTFEVAVDTSNELRLRPSYRQFARAWQLALKEALALNGVTADPTSDSLLIHVIGRRGLDLAMLAPDGGVRTVTTAAEDDYGPVFSSNGRWLAYASAAHSTVARYDVDLMLLDRLTGKVRNIASTPDAYEAPLRFDDAAGSLLFLRDDRTTGALSLCVLELPAGTPQCHQRSRGLDVILARQGNRVLALSTPHADEGRALWEFDLADDTRLSKISSPRIRACATPPEAPLALCRTEDGIGFLDLRRDNPVWQPAHIEEVDRVESIVALSLQGQVSVRAKGLDGILFGEIRPTFIGDEADSFHLSLSDGRRYTSGFFLRREFSPDLPLRVSALVDMPITETRWQGARFWIGQLPRDAYGALESMLASSDDGADGLTRAGMWNRALLCELQVPRSLEPIRANLVLIRGTAEATQVEIPTLAGMPGPMAVTLVFDGVSTCRAEVGGVELKVQTTRRQGLPLQVSLNGSAVGTVGLISQLTITGSPVPR